MTMLVILTLLMAPYPYQRCPHGWHRVASYRGHVCVRNRVHGPHRPIQLRTDLP